MKLAKKAGKGAEWTRLEPPERPGDSAVLDVMKGEPGSGRKEMIQKWAKAVWRSWAHQHDRIRTLCEKWIL